MLDLVHTSEAQMDLKAQCRLLLWCYADPTTIYLLRSTDIMAYSGVKLWLAYSVWCDMKVGFLLHFWGHMSLVCRTQMLFSLRPCNPSGVAQGPLNQPAICCTSPNLLYIYNFISTRLLTYEIHLVPNSTYTFLGFYSVRIIYKYTHTHTHIN